ncbi:MAG: 3-deoxy-7-phosphoheptulonate synthase [Bdellovibrionota bacterium]|nr:3-deoxy-7-phosphoheptulonate synthase [Bdellovibrionota bacterium]
MLILMKADSTESQRKTVCEKIEKLGFRPHPIPGEHSMAIGITGNDGPLEEREFMSLEGVIKCIPVTAPYKLAGKDFKPKGTEVKVGPVTFGEGHFVIIGGPCSVENEEQTIRIAKAVKKSGAQVLRGGAFKPRTSPYSFQGLGLEGLKILKKASLETGLPIISEAIDFESLDAVSEYADIIQIGARNMQNFALLQKVGSLQRPVVLKRGISATLEEWLSSAEYIMQNGNEKVILCERGIRSYDKYTRNLLDLSAVPAIKNLSHLPIIVDPSHGTGRKELIAPMSKGALAVGAHGIMVEVHDRPKEALSDGHQALLPHEFEALTSSVGKMSTLLVS